MNRLLFSVFAFATLPVACRSAPPAPATSSDSSITSVASVAPASSVAAPTASGPSLVASRPYAITIPTAGATPHALVVLLHGYGGNGAEIDGGWGISALGRREGFAVAVPDGTPDAGGRRFWNASEACCGFDDPRAKVDDVAYIRAILDDASARTPIDPKRIFVVGFSNGGFMAHRLGCELSDRLAAVVSVAGAANTDPSRCTPTSPVSVVQVHGTDDNVIAMAGGRTFNKPSREYPSVAQTMAQWSTRLGCSGAPEEGAARLDLDARIPGAETRVDRWRGCKAGLELWTIDGAGHGFAATPSWSESLWAFFKAHPKR